MPVSPVEKSSYTIGVDVGKVRDPAALCVLERRSVFQPGPHHPAHPEHGREAVSYRIRHLERLPLATTYPAVAERVAIVAERLRVSIHPQTAVLSDVVVDVTGVGRPVFDLLADRGLAAQLVGVNFTGGLKANTSDGRIWNVPKRDLVAGLVVMFQARELRIAEQLADASVLVNELVNFRMTLSEAGRDSYGNGGDAEHDDYVTAAALCAWRARLRAPRELGRGGRLV